MKLMHFKTNNRAVKMFEKIKEFQSQAKPFEFGPIDQRDRILLSVVLSKGQGNLLQDQPLPEGILQSLGTSLDGREVARRVFQIFQRFFEQPTAKTLLKDAPVVGVMTDALYVNGRASRLHTGEPKHYVNVTAGTMLTGMVSIYRLIGNQTLRLLGPKAVQDATSSYHNGDIFPIPRSLEIRKQALRCAIYGTIAVFCHELAHVFRGHTTYLSSKLSLDYLEETSSASSNAVTRVRRLMEVDADEFAGKFIADILFPKFVSNRTLLDDREGTRRFLNVAAGVLALYLGFGEGDNVYYSGSVRAYVVLGSLLQRCSNDSESSAWLLEQIEDIQSDMMKAELVDASNVKLDLDELDDLLKVTIPARNAIAADWINLRPWGKD